MSSNDDDDRPPFFPRRDTSDLNGRIMMVAIVSLSVVIVFVAILHIYARLLLRRQNRRRDALRQLGFFTTTQIAASEPPSTGLDPAVISSMPRLVYRQHNGNDDAGAIECAVCLSVMEDGELARVLPNCKHTFHADCIDKWFSSHTTCPICRAAAEPRLVPEPREPPVGVQPTAPPVEPVNSAAEGTSDGGTQSSSAKVSGSNLRLSSFRRMLGGSSRRIQSSRQEQDDGIEEDLERQ